MDATAEDCCPVVDIVVRMDTQKANLNDSFSCARLTDLRPRKRHRICRIEAGDFAG